MTRIGLLLIAVMGLTSACTTVSYRSVVPGVNALGDLQVTAGHQPGQSIVRFTQGNTGWLGGAIGAVRVKNHYASFRDEFTGWFHQQGLLVAVYDHP